MPLSVAFIRSRSEAILTERGMPEKDAAVLVDSMLAAEICGVATHGIRMLPAYVQKIDRGDFSFATPSIVKQFAAFTILDANNTVGAVSADYAVKIAVEQARLHGIHTVLSRNCNTFGAGFYYVEKIAESGMLGLVCCNSPAAMPAFNGLEAMLGTNPVAFAMPTRSYGSVVVDMATSVVAKSKFAVVRDEGKQLEPGWALDQNGNPTTDPDQGIRGLVLPMAGFKGYCIAMMIDIVSGFLSGAGYLNRVGKFYSMDGGCMNVGQMITAFNPTLLYDGDFITDADTYVERLKHSKTLEERQIIIPGERRRKRREEALKMGLCLTEDVCCELEKLFGEKLR